MRNWIKYLPLEWRKRENDCVPGGPSFAKAQRLSMVIGGSRLTLRAPRRSLVGSDFSQPCPPSIDALTQRLLANYGEGYMANRNWGFTELLSGSWTFWGPWMTGAKARFTLSINLAGRLDPYAYRDDISFFHPKAFENMLADYLNDLYGHEGWDSDRPRYVGPVAWQRHHHFPLFSASFDIYRTNSGPSSADSLHERLFVFPITPHRFVEVVFSRSIYQMINGSYPGFDLTPIDSMEKAILDSLELELSPSTQAELDKVRAQCGELQLTETFPPLRWPTDAFVPEPVDPEYAARMAWLEREYQAQQRAQPQAENP